MVESRLRQLVMKLELVDHLELAHPYIKGFDKVCWCINEEERNQAAHGQFPPDRDESQIDKSTATQTHTTTFYIGLCIKAKDPNSNAPRKLDISWPTRDFVGMVRAWDKFDQSSMGIVVQYMKSVALPTEVFEGGEPPRSVKKRPKSRNRSNPPIDENPSKKRRASFTDSVSLADSYNDTENTVSNGRLPGLATKRTNTVDGTNGQGIAEDATPNGSGKGIPNAPLPGLNGLREHSVEQVSDPSNGTPPPPNVVHTYGGMSGTNSTLKKYPDSKLRLGVQQAGNSPAVGASPSHG